MGMIMAMGGINPGNTDPTPKHYHPTNPVPLAWRNLPRHPDVGDVGPGA